MFYIMVMGGTVIIIFFIGLLLGWYFTGHKYCCEIKRYQRDKNKNLTLVRIYDIWMLNESNKKYIDDYLLSKGINNVAIYGISFLGARLFQKLKKNGKIKVAYILDQNPQIQLPEVKIFYPGKEKRKVDVVIVTAIFSFDMIQQMLREYGYEKIYALDDILYDLLKEV